MCYVALLLLYKAIDFINLLYISSTSTRNMATQPTFHFPGLTGLIHSLRRRSFDHSSFLHSIKPSQTLDFDDLAEQVRYIEEALNHKLPVLPPLIQRLIMDNVNQLILNTDVLAKSIELNPLRLHRFDSWRRALHSTVEIIANFWDREAERRAREVEARRVWRHKGCKL
ncbi:MAG: hypothetical protein Q9219_005889 [cf. Caloplaca sp. 3 TL-2023]